MNPLRRGLLARAILFALATPTYVAAQLAPDPAPVQCGLSAGCSACAVPLFKAVADPQPLPLRASADGLLDADNFTVVDENRYHAEGSVEFQRADQRVWTEALDYDTSKGELAFHVPFRFQDKDILITGENGLWKEAGDSRFNAVRFQMRDGKGNGRASHVTVDANNLIYLHRTTFTSCAPDHAAWLVKAAEIKLDRERGRAVAHHTTLHLGSVPILYLPVMSFPLDDKRQTGVLPPGISNSGNSGLDLSLPVYLNLAPNYDATLTPRLLTGRGPVLGGEFRYLDRMYNGTFDGDILPNDSDRENDVPNTRYRIDFEHRQRFSDHWSMNASVRDVSDDRYFEDFGNSLSSVSTSLLPSSLYLNGRGRNWSLSFGADQVQITDPRFSRGSQPYDRLPRLFGSVATSNLRGPVAGLDGEYVEFSKNGFVEGQRVDLRPWVGWPIEGASWFLRPRLSYRSTFYNLDTPTDQNRDRNLPIASFDAGLLFDRSVGSHGWTQTLEPRAFFLYAPFRNQDDLPVFDTQDLTFSFAQLFRENTFSGADRQSDANQVALTVSSRMLDDLGKERMRFGVGQIRYFDDPEVTLPGARPRSGTGSAYVGEFGLALSDHWSATASQQYDPGIDELTLSSLGAQYRFGQNGVVNAAYRYRLGLLEQTDVTAAVPLNDRWRLVFRHNQSLRDHQLLEAFGGIEYDGCCFAVRFVVRRFVRNLEGDLTNGFTLEFDLKGLTRIGTNTGDFLRRAILGYR